MSAITVDNVLVHYEVLGRGRPVILLHGWLGSWRYWVPVMQQLNARFRVYALDLWGFGESGRDARRYGLDAQVALVGEFMDKLGIAKAAIVGHDLGAAIGARYAARHADRVPRLMAVCPPLFWMAPRPVPLTSNPSPAAQQDAPVASPVAPAAPPASASPPAALADEPAADAPAPPAAPAAEPAAVTPKPPRDAATPPTDQPVHDIAVVTPPPLPDPLPEVPAMPRMDYVPEANGQVPRPNPLKEHLATLDRLELLKRHVDPGPDLDKLRVEVEKGDTLALSMSVEAFAEVDTLADLRGLTMPTVMIYGATDTFVPAPDDKMLASLREGCTAFHAIALANTRHFPMLENIAGFTRLVQDFLEVPDVTRLTIKETWERRVR